MVLIAIIPRSCRVLYIFQCRKTSCLFRSLPLSSRQFRTTFLEHRFPANSLPLRITSVRLFEDSQQNGTTNISDCLNSFW